MEAAPKQRDLEYSLLRETVAGKERKGICSAVIFGPNAAGKSALVAALRDLQGIVARGSVSAKGGGRDLSLVPCSFEDEPGPTAFEVTFTRDGTLYEYALAADLGTFGFSSSGRCVVEERLVVDGSPVFARGAAGVSIWIPKGLEGLFGVTYQENRDAADALLSSVEPTDLFLCNGFRTMVSPALAGEVSSWFSDDLIVLDRANETSVFPLDPKENAESLGERFTEAARLFGTSARDSLVFVDREGSDEHAELYTATRTPQGVVGVPSSKYESLGTIRFLNMLPFVEVALLGGKVLVMDELDASLHPMAVMSIVNAFHDDETNVHHAQLIFTTHNPTFLDASLFRRDEIKIVERDEATGHSVAYALSDFGTAGSRGVRSGEDYQRGYLGGRYGGIRDVDLVPYLRTQVMHGISMDLTPEPDAPRRAGDGESINPRGRCSCACR